MKNIKNSKKSDSHKLLLNLPDKVTFKRSDKCVPLSNISIQYIQKNIKNSCKNNNLKISTPTWNDKFEFHLDHILYDTFEIILSL